MENKTAKWLLDIINSIGEITEFQEKEDIISFSHYRSNKLVKRAIERNLSIIGEAVNRIKQSDSDTFSKIEHARAIISLRNHVIHANDGISDENIWSILINHLPKLEAEVKTLIGEQ